MFDRKDNDEQGAEMEGEDGDGESTSNGLEQFGLFHYVMIYASISNTPIEQIFDTPIAIVLMAIDWNNKMNKLRDQEAKKWRLTH